MKSLITFINVVVAVCFLSFEPALADEPTVEWEKTIGVRNLEFGLSVQQTSDDGYIIIGYTRPSGPDGGDSDVYMVKTNDAGILQWQRNFGGIKSDVGCSVQETFDGGYIIAGYTESYGAGYWDVYLIKTDLLGLVDWETTFGTSEYDVADVVQQTSDAGYIIAGATRSYGAAGRDVYLIKTDSDGNMIWQKTLGGSLSESANSLQQTTDGGYIIVGYTTSYGAGSSDVYLVKTDANGIMQWHQTFGASSSESGSSVQQTTDGGYVIAGTTSSFGAVNSDVYLIKTDSNGSSQWQKTFGGNNYDGGSSVRQTCDGGYIIAGKINDDHGGSCDAYLIKTDFAGNMQWQKTFGGTYRDWATSVQQTIDGGCIVAGTAGVTRLPEDFDFYLIKIASEVYLPGDLDGNRQFDYKDLLILTDNWLEICYPPCWCRRADLDKSGLMDFDDFAGFAKRWFDIE